ncbi:TonB-dependent receptor plug domain-containing protein [Labilibacter marinus]|uniref:TonB-dependent receptor plug domain-containing protein n=1 Tax=Labilibacter marinus TaxID=1477105 RepID=UPI0013011E14|nr:TonB-dependent receptor [Labilibacter marinus]
MMCITSSLLAQQKKDVNSITKAEVLEMTIEELSAYDLEEVMKLMDITGASSLEELYELLLNKDVTSASKSEESLFDSPLSTTVLKQEQIIASGATSIEEALRLVPGLIVREKTNGTYDVHIRGNDNIPGKNMLLYSENSNTLVMIDGRPVFNYSHGATLWETLPISFVDIEQIEVVRGPSSALYGPNAVTGVINILTKKTNSSSPLVSANLQGGSLNTYIGDLAFRKSFNEKLNIGLTGNYEIRDREKEELYVYNGGSSPEDFNYWLDGDDKAVGSDYYTTEQMSRLQLLNPYTRNEPLLNPKDGKPYYLWPAEGTNEYAIYDTYSTYPNPELSKKKMGVNAYVSFNPNKTTTIDLSGGYQYSDVMTSTMCDMPSSYGRKDSKTGYADLNIKIKDFSFQTNYNGGTTNYAIGNEGFELDLQQFTSQAEYNLKLEKISIRPGVSFQSMSYDDSKHLTELGRGYLNSKQTVNIAAGSLRLDYKPTEKLRLVAALRAEKYNNPSDVYGSWQFVGSYKINENNIFRAVYSRANQSAFLVNTYSNYSWNVVNRPYPNVIHFDGDKDHQLKTMDMFEIGYRIRPSKNVLIDIEGFYNITENGGALMPDYTSATFYNVVDAAIDIADNGQFDTNAPVAIPDSIHMTYLNMPLKSKQLGASVNVDWVISEKLVANAHITVQQTKLDNYLAYSRDDIIEYQVGKAVEQTIGLALHEMGQGGTVNPVQTISSSEYPTDFNNDYKHESTPSYFGGLSLTYRPIKKLEIFPQSYFYGAQKFENQYGDVNIDSKFLLNAKVSYKANDKLTLFLNGRNILNNKTVEFAYMDNTPTLVLVGFNFKL